MTRTGRCLVAIGLLASAAACSGDDGITGPSVDATFATQPPPTSTTVPVEPTTPTTDAATTSSTPVVADPTPRLGEPVAVADQPVDLAVRPGGPFVRPGEPATMYLVERPGRIRRLDPSGALGAVVLDISGDTEATGERGLLGLTFSLDGRYAYINFTTNGGDTNIDEYTVADDGTFDPASRRRVYEIPQPYGNHNGGDLEIGPNGLLYLFTGDGGSGGDPERRALDLRSPLGKVLRIAPWADGDRPYTVPPDNPFVGVEGALPEIWAVGLRNPWRSSFDTVRGDLWIADVGQNDWEEISVGWATDGVDAGKGLSFGWSAYEGTHRYHDDQPADGHTPPIFEYPHGDLGCSISGGVRYRGLGVAGLQGWYVFSDYCSGLVRALEVLPDRTAGRVIDIGVVPSSTAVVAGLDGELYVLSLDGPIVPIVG